MKNSTVTEPTVVKNDRGHIATNFVVDESPRTSSNSPNRKYIVVGHKQHGKDTVSALLSERLNVTWASSSLFACKKAVFPTLSKLYGYTSIQECYDDRDNHRAEWFNLICEYNKDDLARLGKEIFDEHDIYCGLRNIHELKALVERVPNIIVIWVYGSMRKPLEDINSFTITQAHADVIIDNNAGLEDLKTEITRAIPKIDWFFKVSKR
jgi:hypothetical protein